jgi:hypothetical protein
MHILRGREYKKSGLLERTIQHCKLLVESYCPDNNILLDRFYIVSTELNLDKSLEG